MSLYQLAHDGDADELLTKLWESDSSAVRARAAELLGDIGTEDDEELIRGVVEAAREDESVEVRAAAIDALDQLGTAAVERLLAEMTGAKVEAGADWVTAKRFAKALDADQPELRMAAANALGRIGGGEVVPRLVGALDDPDARVRARAAGALGSVGDPRAVDPLTGALDDGSGEVKRAAADALAAIGGDSALEPLLGLLDDEKEVVRWIAASALGNASSAGPVEPLASTLTDDSAAVRRAAVYSIVQLLSNAPTDRSHQVREAVVSELSEADDRHVVDPLVEILVEGNQRPQRRNAAWLLGRVTGEAGRDAVADALVTALEDEDTTMAQFAATSLTTVGGERVERQLLDLVEDLDVAEDVRAKAVFVLGKVGGERSRERLEKLTNEAEDKEVRRRAFAALSKLGGAA